MTEMLFYQNAYQQILPETPIIARRVINDHSAVALEQTIFYPTGGGQPHDLGRLNDVAVLDVFKDDAGTVWHVLAEPLDASVVRGEIDWARRFDFMQQHTGQHILSRAFEVLFDANTVGFHLSENSVTIDLDRDDLTSEMIYQAENLANEVVIENLPVKAWFPDSETLHSLPLRKLSDKVTGAVRVVEVGDFDVCACGGTHVIYTGEIGIIKILRQERVKRQTRLEFACGKRALLDYREKNAFLLDLSAQFTTSWQDIPLMIDKLREENKRLQKSVRALQENLLRYQAEELWAQADHTQTPVVVTFVAEDYAMSELQQLARMIVAHSNTVALLGTFGESAQLVFARADDLAYLDVVPYLKQALQVLGSQRGGGRPTMAQGGGVSASAETVQEVLERVAKTIKRE
ncbi:MAG: alanyl-tRNA editing protein [Phototrophicales bacterium]|nr:MAG: alanyl-tRNA editing protein [Phototrophicales bacterium]